jgi:predicted amidohydrolase
MSLLRIGLLQYGVQRIDSFEAYADRLDTLVRDGASGADLLVMPEYGCMELASTLTEKPDPEAELDAVCAHSHDILAVMRQVVRKHSVWLQPGTVPFRDGTHVRNRAPLIAPDGRVAFQDKRVMTRFENEAWRVSAGDDPAVFDTPWGRIGIAICYDSEFPTLVRAQVEAGAWLILVPTCTDGLHGFNRVRLSARARALENQCFVAVSPTVGEAPWLATLDINRGAAGIYGPVDRGFPEDGVIVEGRLDEPGWIFATLDPAVIPAVREDGAVRNYRDWPATVRACPVLSPKEDCP